MDLLLKTAEEEPEHWAAMTRTRTVKPRWLDGDLLDVFIFGVVVVFTVSLSHLLHSTLWSPRRCCFDCPSKSIIAILYIPLLRRLLLLLLLLSFFLFCVTLINFWPDQCPTILTNNRQRHGEIRIQSMNRSHRRKIYGDFCTRIQRFKHFLVQDGLNNLNHRHIMKTFWNAIHYVQQMTSKSSI